MRAPGGGKRCVRGRQGQRAGDGNARVSSHADLPRARGRAAQTARRQGDERARDEWKHGERLFRKKTERFCHASTNFLPWLTTCRRIFVARGGSICPLCCLHRLHSFRRVCRATTPSRIKRPESIRNVRPCCIMRVARFGCLSYSVRFASLRTCTMPSSFTRPAALPPGRPRSVSSPAAAV